MTIQFSEDFVGKYEMKPFGDFKEVWCVDFEFGAEPGERPEPRCLVAYEWRSRQTHRVWEDELYRLGQPPYSTTSDCLFVAFYASAELGCHLTLGWALPTRVLDLYVEFRNCTNGLCTPCGRGLLGALSYYGLDGIHVMEKADMRHLALRGGPWTSDEQAALLAYCESDVMALNRLLTQIGPELDLPRALLRGRYMVAAAKIEHNGIPIDTHALSLLHTHWHGIQDSLIAKIDRNYDVFEGRTFKTARFEQFLADRDMPWPRLLSGTLDLKDDTFRDMAKTYPILNPLRELLTRRSRCVCNRCRAWAFGWPIRIANDSAPIPYCTAKQHCLYCSRIGPCVAFVPSSGMAPACWANTK